MDLKNIEAFLAIIKEGTFSAAAEALYVSQPTISMRIKALEKDLNVNLFERLNGNKVVLTEVGKKILPLFEEGLRLFQEGGNYAREYELKQSTITISLPFHLGEYILPELLEKLYHKFKNTDFQIKIRKTPETLNDLKHGIVDIGFVYMPPYKLCNNDNLNPIHIAELINTLVCSPQHKMYKRSKILFSEFNGERIFVLSKAFTTSKIIQEHLNKNGLHNFTFVEVNDQNWIKELLKKNLGISFMHLISVQNELNNGTLVELPIEKALPSTSVYLLSRTTVPEYIRNSIIRISQRLSVFNTAISK